MTVTLTLDFGREHVVIEPRYVMAFHPVWIASPECPEDPKSGRLVTRVFFATGMQMDVIDEIAVVAAKLVVGGWA